MGVESCVVEREIGGCGRSNVGDESKGKMCHLPQIIANRLFLVSQTQARPASAAWMAKNTLRIDQAGWWSKRGGRG